MGVLAAKEIEIKVVLPKDTVGKARVGHNTFRRHLMDQRECVATCLGVLSKVIGMAYEKNRPVLAS